MVDGTPQSHVDLDDPSRLFFEYVQRIGHVIDEWGDPGQPMTALHLGAGALTLPRYIHATRPGSRQQVIELDEALVAFVREHLPLPTQSGIRVRYGDARAMLARLPAALHGAVDLVVVDVFSGARIPAHVTSAEFYREVAAFLAPGGIIAVNVADGPGLAFARGQAATLRLVLDDVAALAETRGHDDRPQALEQLEHLGDGRGRSPRRDQALVGDDEEAVEVRIGEAERPVRLAQPAAAVVLGAIEDGGEIVLAMRAQGRPLDALEEGAELGVVGQALRELVNEAPNALSAPHVLEQRHRRPFLMCTADSTPCLRRRSPCIQQGAGSWGSTTRGEECRCAARDRQS